MNNRITGFWASATVSLLLVASADAATYRVLPRETDVLAGTTTGLSVEVETDARDNVVNHGYFSFAIDLTLTGTAGAMGSDIRNILINEVDFDDLSSSSFGFPQGGQYLGIAGMTTDIAPPTFGHNVGDRTWLFDFELTIPETAQLYQTITITPSEGVLENLIANANFDNVSPQNLRPATLTVVPEPSSLILLTVLAGVALGRRRARHGSCGRSSACG